MRGIRIWHMEFDILCGVKDMDVGDVNPRVDKKTDETYNVGMKTLVCYAVSKQKQEHFVVVKDYENNKFGIGNLVIGTKKNKINNLNSNACVLISTKYVGDISIYFANIYLVKYQLKYVDPQMDTILNYVIRLRDFFFTFKIRVVYILTRSWLQRVFKSFLFVTKQFFLLVI